MKMENKPILILKRKAEKLHNRVILPKEFIEKYGDNFYMEIYTDKIVIKPANDSIFDEKI